MRKPGKAWMNIYYLVVKIYDKSIIMCVFIRMNGSKKKMKL